MSGGLLLIKPKILKFKMYLVFLTCVKSFKYHTFEYIGSTIYISVCTQFHVDCGNFYVQLQRTYVICRLEYKGHDMSILSSNTTDPVPTFVPNAANSTASGSVVSQSVQGNLGSFSTFFDYDSANQGQWFNGDFNLEQPVVPYDDGTYRIWDYVVEENFSRYRL